MATFGEALAALDDFRADLVNARHDAVEAGGDEAFAFAGPVATSDDPLDNVHATGLGVKAGTTDQFVLKVFLFDPPGTQSLPAVLTAAYQGVPVESEYLPVQFAYGKKKGGGSGPQATTPADHQKKHRPVPAGVEIGLLGGNFVGTLGCFVRRGADGPLFVLSNNHVLANVNRFAIGQQFTQPFSASPADVICALSQFEPIQFPTPQAQPRNVIDAAIAAVADPRLALLATQFGIGKYVPQLLAARPGMAVTKAGRTTGVTTGVVRAIRVRGVQVNYGTRQNPIIGTFDNAIQITNPNGPAFSMPGDSGSVILDAETKRPVALLFAGNGPSTTACDITAACNRFNVRPV